MSISEALESDEGFECDYQIGTEKKHLKFYFEDHILAADGPDCELFHLGLEVDGKHTGEIAYFLYLKEKKTQVFWKNIEPPYNNLGLSGVLTSIMSEHSKFKGSNKIEALTAVDNIASQKSRKNTLNLQTGEKYKMQMKPILDKPGYVEMVTFLSEENLLQNLWQKVTRSRKNH